MSELLDAAINYATRGWPTSPCKPGAKTPLTAHGIHDATTDTDTIRAWWQRWPDANVAVATGHATDVLDIDHHDPAEGTAGWPDIDMPGGPVARTPKGWHFHVLPTGHGNRARIGGVAADWRGKGGYVIVPPSVVDGNTYRWITPPDVAAHNAPPELLALIAPPAPQRPPQGHTATNPGSIAGWSPHGLFGRLATAVEGERNTILHWCAARVGTDVAARKVAEPDALAALDQLTDLALRAGLGEREVDATIRSGYRAGLGAA